MNKPFDTVETAIGRIYLRSGETCDADEASRRERLHKLIAQTLLEEKLDPQNRPNSDELG